MQQSSLGPILPLHHVQNPLPKPSWKIIITQKVLVTQHSNNLWSIVKNFSQKFHILLILTGKNALKWFEWCIFRVQGMPNPMAQVSSLYDKWFLKNQNFRQKFHILLILTGKMHWNGLSGAYLGFKACLNPMAQVSSPYDKWFLKNQNFRRTSTIKWG